ncbi:MAG: alpha-amylase family glycosyl hydrolase [Chloroflexota bacterium]
MADGPTPDRAFHVTAAARRRYEIEPTLADASGDLVAADRAAIRRLAARINQRRAGPPIAQAGELTALALIHEVFHLVVERYEADVRPGAIAEAMAAVRTDLGEAAFARLMERFGETFPHPLGTPEPESQLVEELILTRIANENPAATPLRELFDDRSLDSGVPYPDAIAALERFFAAAPGLGDDGASLLELLRAPARNAPTSLVGQLRYIRERWRGLLGDALDRLMGQLDLAIGVLVEEEQDLHRRFGGRGGFEGRAEAPDLTGLEAEPERFSSDSAWMPRLVLMAKSTYVWLDQLSRRHRRDIRTLDQVPDEELDRLARWGVSGLWLIGLWERSKASERIKRARGNADAVASAYSLDDYRIADDLGGEAAHGNLRERAWARGIRLASDMVPNHMGIDSHWVTEHPEWFLSLDQPPYPSYTFNGPDLSSDERAGIVLEDHYWDDSDAAVVFKRFDRHSGGDRYIYHGNDGTSFPWNDTAQLDFLNPDVREQVIRTILDVARRFPVIRFDAAMVLARKHIERLWWPEPGSGGGIPSRAEFGSMPRSEFERRMPKEFWREVVDRVATEVPDTLLLAEAFWLLEGYFVRTLGMHRVYNSAFMHMLRDEDNAGYRKVMKDTLEFDPEILKRYVNFMSNPDERTAVEQFGKGDKYFGVATLLATLPGLPMIGHGQVEGFGEKYGMEFRRATLDEQPDAWLVERHEREIFPILHRRGWFAGAEDFLLYDFVRDDGSVDENVFAYSNGRGAERSLVVYHNRFASTAGWIRDSAAFAVKAPDGSRRLERRTLRDGLGLPGEDDAFLAFRDGRTGLEYLRAATELRDRGLYVQLDAYRGHVFWEFRELRDGVAGQWSRLAGRLGGGGVPSLEDALRELQLEPVHEPLRALFRDGLAGRLIDGPPSPADVKTLRDRHEAFLRAVAETTGVAGDPAPIAAEAGDRIERLPGRAASQGDGEDRDRSAALTLLAWIVLSPMGRLARGPDPAATSRAWYDELRLAPVVAAALRDAGLEEGAAWAAADLLRSLLGLARPSTVGGRGDGRDAALLNAWLGDDDARRAIGVNPWQGVEWLDRDRFRTMLRWASRLDAAEEGSAPDVGLVERLSTAADAAGYRLDRLKAAVAGPGGGRTTPAATKRGPRGARAGSAGGRAERLPEDEPPKQRRRR